jgi:hypothetical protein
MPELTITAVAREVGVRPSTLRYYERIGLLPATRRVAGRRRYDDCALKSGGTHYLRQTGWLHLGANSSPSGKRLPRQVTSLALARSRVQKGSRVGSSDCQSTSGEKAARGALAVSVSKSR